MKKKKKKKKGKKVTVPELQYIYGIFILKIISKYLPVG